MSLKVIGINDKVNLAVNPPEMYVILEVSDGTSVAELPLGPDAHAALFAAFPNLLRGVVNKTRAAATTPPAKVASAPAPPQQASGPSVLVDEPEAPAAEEELQLLSDIGNDGWDSFELHPDAEPDNEQSPGEDDESA